MKILALSTIRSDYDLMSGLYKALNDDPDIELKLLIAGAHLTATYGMTLSQVEEDGFDILLKSETLLDSDSPAGRLKSASIMLFGFIDTVAAYKPDLILYAGDREDVIIGALMGGYLSIPTMHFFSGDHAADGHVDNPIRHATTKLSTYHCASVEEHAERLRAIGEPDERISVVGSIALDKFVSHESMSQEKIFSELNLPYLGKKTCLIIFHPIGDEKKIAVEILNCIIQALIDFGFFVFVGAPNSDPDNRQLFNLQADYNQNKDVFFYKSLPLNLFLSIFKQSSLIAGNSSAGILEAASIPIPAINVGARQIGRLAGDNVIFCGTDKEAIIAAIEKACSPIFLSSIKNIKNLYGDGDSIKKAVRIIKETNFSKILHKKEDPILVKWRHLND
jgi:UDP-hydrolysing UDP-N-acetyl-D-glucosamine 2-epimerase